MKKILYVGMDVHKENISTACAAEGEEVRHYGTMPNHLAALGFGSPQTGRNGTSSVLRV
jgi:hypothetical protein